MISIDVTKLSIAVFNRLAIDAEGASIRGMLATESGSVSGAENIVAADDLLRGARPPRPFIVIGEADVFVRERIIQAARFRITVFDEIDQGSARINALIPLISAAYEHTINPILVEKTLIGYSAMVNLSSKYTDPALNFGARYADVIADCTW